MTTLRPSNPPSFLRASQAFAFAAAFSVVLATPGLWAGETLKMLPPAELSALVGHSLPAGWKVERVDSPALPPGWLSTRVEATNITVSGPQTRATISFVPLDWIGIQSRSRINRVPVATDLVRISPTAKLIYPDTGAGEWPWLATIAPQHASLAAADASPGSYFIGRKSEVEYYTRRLVETEGIDRDTAVESLIHLGIPAPKIFRQIADDNGGRMRIEAIQALAHFPDELVISTILHILNDHGRRPYNDASRLAAVKACPILHVDNHGPALLVALKYTRDDTVVAAIAEEINRIRFHPAVPELRRYVRNARTPEARAACACALATLRATEAAPEIAAAMQQPTSRRAEIGRPVDLAARVELETELHRLTGAWGEPNHDFRLSINMESPGHLVVYLENMNDRPYGYVPFPCGVAGVWPMGLVVRLDGQSISPSGPNANEMNDLSARTEYIQPGHAQRFEFDISNKLTNTSRAPLTASWLGLEANAIYVPPHAAVASQPARSPSS